MKRNSGNRRGAIRSLLRVAARLSGPGSSNYTVSLGYFAAPDVGDLPVPDIVRRAVGDEAKSEGPTACTLQDLVAEVRRSLENPGDDAAHPSPEYYDGPDFRTDLESALSEVETLLGDCEHIWSVRIVDGHPFYPVFWEFAFVFVRGAEGGVLIGSGSD